MLSCKAPLHTTAASLNFNADLQVKNYRPKILQQGNSNTDILSEEFPKLLMKSLVFRAPLVVGSFLVKLKTTTKCFKLNNVHNNLKDSVYGQFVLRNIVGCCRLLCMIS